MANDQPTILAPKHFRFDIVDSTNEVAKRLIADGSIAHPAYISAREQTAGKGSRGRTWLSPRDAGIYLSVIDFPPADLQPDLTLFTLAAGVACVETLTEHAGIRVYLKPVNDLYLDGRKLGGILTEAIHEGGNLRAVITGIGINTRIADRNVGSDVAPPTSLQEHMPLEAFAHLDQPALIESIIHNIFHWHQRMWKGGTDAVLDGWDALRIHGAPPAAHLLAQTNRPRKPNGAPGASSA